MKPISIPKQIESLKEELITWRHDLHKYPELAFEERRTSEFVASQLQKFGIKVYRNLAKTGVVGELKSGSSKSKVALRADMDAVPITEINDLEYKSVNAGVMHACGHDGHTAMLLGAAKYLARTKQFDGIVYFIFQPAEETGDGAKTMMADGLFNRFPAQRIFGLHIAPPVKSGYFSIFAGPMLAASSTFDIQITGKGTHGAHPQRGKDLIVIASEMVTLFQSIVSRRLNPLDPAVLSVTQFHGGTAYNILPGVVELKGTVRTMSNTVRDQIKDEMERIIKGICYTHEINNSFKFLYGDPAVINTPEETNVSITAAEKVVGKDQTWTKPRPTMASEDFGFFLEQKPGCYVGLGNGAENGANHSAQFLFNDEILTTGVAYLVQLTED